MGRSRYLGNLAAPEHEANIIIDRCCSVVRLNDGHSSPSHALPFIRALNGSLRRRPSHIHAVQEEVSHTPKLRLICLALRYLFFLIAVEQSGRFC